FPSPGCFDRAATKKQVEACVVQTDWFPRRTDSIDASDQDPQTGSIRRDRLQLDRLSAKAAAPATDEHRDAAVESASRPATRRRQISASACHCQVHQGNSEGGENCRVQVRDPPMSKECKATNDLV